MEMKKYLGVQQRVDFVDAVMKMSEVEGKHSHALFGFAFRVAALSYFYPELNIGSIDEAEPEAYSDKYEKLYKDPAVASILRELMDACCKEIHDRHEQYMVVYRSVVNPDPLNRIADAVDKAAGDFGSVLNKDSLTDMMSEIYARRAEKGEQTKEPVVVNFAVKK